MGRVTRTLLQDREPRTFFRTGYGLHYPTLSYTIPGRMCPQGCLRHCGALEDQGS